MDWQHNFERRRDALGGIPRLAELAESKERDETAARRAPLPLIHLQILLIFFPDEIVRIVEGTTGWPDLRFGNREGDQDQALQMRPGNFTPLRRVVQAFRDIWSKTWTAEILYFVHNLQEFKTLLGSLLDDLKLCRELRFCRTAQPPLDLLARDPSVLSEINPTDLTVHADALEVFLIDFEAVDHVVMRLETAQLDEHIVSVHQVIEFLR